MRAAKLLWIASVIGLAQSVIAAPRMLILQLRPPLSNRTHAHVFVGDLLTHELDSLARVSAIAWSEMDPIFRQAVMDGVVRNVPERPSIEHGREAARALKCEYLLAVEAVGDGGNVEARATLYRDGRQVWTDTKRMSGSVAGAGDPDGVARSLARTWALMLDSGPLKSLPTQPKQQTPDAQPGKIEELQAPQAPPQLDNAKLMAEVDRLRKAGQDAQALALMRDGVDLAPFDPARRRALIQMLMEMGRTRAAAGEARRAAALFPEDAEIRAIAANAWLASGDGDQAKLELNEAVARNPNDRATRMLLADTSLRELRAAEALEHLKVVAASGRDRATCYKMALALALLGETAAMEVGLAEASAVKDRGDLEAAYAIAAVAVHSATVADADEIRSLFQRALVRREDPEVARALRAQRALLSARLLYMQAFDAPEVHAQSHGRRLLALKLLAQSLTTLESFLKDGEEGTAVEARIDLGEALKELAAAQQAYDAELQRSKGASDARP